MKRGGEYFVDSSVWIPYFRGGDTELNDLIDELLDEDRISINGIVMIELLKGSRIPEELDRLSSALSGLKFVGGGGESAQAAGRNGFALKRKGVSVPLSDLIVATDCIDRGLVLIERDAHFAAIAAILPLRRFRSSKA
jgi:predicted nucleic acid-binding protein